MTGFTPSGESQSWTLDAAGNWSSVTSDGSTVDRTADGANQITSISGASNPTYDAVGNLTFDGTDHYQYNAWNQLVQITNGSDVPLAQYQYDGVGRRVEQVSFDTNGDPQSTTYYFFDGASPIETCGAIVVNGHPVADAQNPQYQYVWSPLSVKTPILRDGSFGQYGAGTTASRLYYLTDANNNVTAVVGLAGSSWGVSERYVYDPYGNVTYYTSNWSGHSTTPYLPSSSQNTLLFAAMDLDAATGSYYDEARWYSPSLGTFITQDPAAADANLYRYCGNNPTGATDPTGRNVYVIERPLALSSKWWAQYLELWTLPFTVFDPVAFLATAIVTYYRDTTFHGILVVAPRCAPKTNADCYVTSFAGIGAKGMETWDFQGLRQDPSSAGRLAAPGG